LDTEQNARVSLFLTRDELMEMTERKQRLKVIDWLSHNGYRFDLAADGWPKVLRAGVEAKLMPTTSRRTTPKFEPDFSVYYRQTKRRGMASE
jgi:Domain of unknown function (DUF4224)